jgi:hypothetical protein
MRRDHDQGQRHADCEKRHGDRRRPWRFGVDERDTDQGDDRNHDQPGPFDGIDTALADEDPFPAGLEGRQQRLGDLLLGDPLAVARGDEAEREMKRVDQRRRRRQAL